LTILVSAMRSGEEKLRVLGVVFAAAVTLSAGLTLLDYSDYLGLLDSMKKVTYTVDEMTHGVDGDKVEVAITFTVLNPTSYTRLKFSSLQCQLYLVSGGEEEYMGATGYAPPVDVPLRPGDGRTYTTMLEAPRSNVAVSAGAPLETTLEWRVRSVVHFSTPLRSYYQTYSQQSVSALVE
jgi:hypothetical protein